MDEDDLDMAQNEDEEEGGGWDINALFYGRRHASIIPPETDVRQLVHDYYRYWFEDRPHASRIHAWLWQKLDITENNVEWPIIEKRITAEAYRFARLKRFCKSHDILEDADIGPKITKLDGMRHVVRETILANFRCFVHCTGNALPNEVARPEDSDVPCLSNYDETKLKSFQTLFIKVLTVLASCDLRRADGQFFERVVTRSGLATQTFRPLMTIETFIHQHTRIEDNFVAWKEVTDSPSVYHQMVDYLKTRPLCEASELEENPRLRSYEGDEYGRGAVIYDCAQDMAWPLANQDAWFTMEKDMNERRKLIYGSNNFVPCTPPSPEDVCIKHMDAVFPYDTYQETLEIDAMKPGLCWREVSEFECRHERKDSNKRSINFEISSDTLRCILDERFPTSLDMEPRVWGRRWQPVVSSADFSRLEEFEACPELIDAIRNNNAIDDKWIEHCHEHSKVTVAGIGVYVPLCTRPRCPRVRLTKEEYRSIVRQTGPITHMHWVRVGERYFRPHTGRMWRDCLMEEVEKIFLCQEFTLHDRFMIYALMGRTLFRVGEFDNSQITLMFQGIGGCGKSTIMKLMQLFWSHHRMGILSANIEGKFGMSQVLRGVTPSTDGSFPKSIAYAIFCNEVSRDLNLVQEEWQTSCSNEVGSYAVKHKAPIECVCQAQHFWVGNEFPSHFKNGQDQVSRRLAGVRMQNPVQPRNERIFEDMEREVASVQRCIVLAYKEYLVQQNDVDPMSKPERLPPAFKDYYDSGRRSSNPVQAFVDSNEYVQKQDGGKMLMRDFKTLLVRYCSETRTDRPVGRVEDICRPIFQNIGVYQIEKEPEAVIDGTTYHNVHIIVGLVAVPRPM